MNKIEQIANFKDVVMYAINELSRDHKDIIMLDADLKSCLSSDSFEKEFPDRFFNCGIAEANMVGVAAGLSSMGLVPFAHSFGCFASRRTYDQFFLSCNYAKQKVHLIGTDPGVTAQLNGGTHMPFEDIALMRQIPNLTIIEPSDNYSIYSLVKQLYFIKGSSYLRVPRKTSRIRYNENDKFELGKAIRLRSGKDISIIATGVVMVDIAQKAAETLAKEGISASVIDLHTIKPLDYETILEEAKKTKRMIVCENGRYAGGIGEGISAYLSQNYPIYMDYLNVGERFGEVGKLDYLLKAFNFTEENLVAKAKALIKK